MKPVIELWGLPLPAFGLMMALAVLAGVAVCVVLGWRKGISIDFMLDASLYAVGGGIVGARVLGLIVEWRAVLTDPWDALWYAGGLHYYGGFLGGAAALWWLARRRQISLPHLADVMAPGLLLGQAIGRMACLLHGCCYGCIWHQAPAPLGLAYPRIPSPGTGPKPTGSIPFLDHLEKGLIYSEAPTSLTTAPVPVLESVFCLILFLYLLPQVWRRPSSLYPRRPGQLALVSVLSYAGGRFFLEFFRGDAARGSLLGLSTSQFIALGTTAFVLFLWSQNRKYSAPVVA